MLVPLVKTLKIPRQIKPRPVCGTSRGRVETVSRIARELGGTLTLRLFRPKDLRESMSVAALVMAAEAALSLQRLQRLRLGRRCG